VSEYITHQTYTTLNNLIYIHKNVKFLEKELTLLMKLFAKISLFALAGVQAVQSATFGTPLAYAAPSKIPSVEVMQGFPDVKKINIAEYCSGKNVVVVGLPGAFTPT
jgi:hypothetical protein